MTPEKEPSSSSQNSPEPWDLLHTLGALFSGVLFVSFLSKMRRLDNQRSDPNTNQDNTRYERQNRQGQAVRPIIETVSPSHTPPKQSDANNGGKNKGKIFNIVIKVCTIGLLAVVAFLNYRQLQTQIQTMRVDERPWIAEASFSPVIKVDAFISANITFANVGKAPAFNFTVRMDDEILRPGEPFQARYRDNVTVWKPGSFYPGINFNWPYTFQAGDKFTEDLLRDITNDKVALYHFEEVTYNDAFGKPHLTHFCGFFNRYMKLELCPFYNDTDYEK